jgi:2,4-dienoyl-CoA reductase (NADPH2)
MPVGLFSPIRIGTLELANRIVMSPMTTGYAGNDGLPTEALGAYLEERAHGGVGLIELEACTVDSRHREVPRSMHFDSDDVIAPHRELTQRLHAHGVPVFPQLVHPGPDGLAPFLSGIPGVGPSVIPSYLTGAPSLELDVEGIEIIVAQFGAAARRIRAAGYDGMELHAAHGYMLLGSFLSPWRNKRSDAFAGSHAEGRLELPRRVLAAIRREAGDDFPVMLRVSGYERVPSGRALSDTQRVAGRLVEAGVDAFHVSGGVIDRLTSQIVTGTRYGDAHNLGAATALKRVVDVPVMVVGRIHDPALAERIVRRGDVDLVAMGRPLLADPQLPNKVRSGRANRVRRCISCQNCIDSMEIGEMNCAVNGASGRELERRFDRAAESRNVWIIGAGPAGLETARIAALRGHRVTLCEQHAVMGGALRAAAIVHPDNERLLDFLISEVERSGVRIRLGEPVSAATLRGEAADAMVVATGGRLTEPSIPGSEQRHVVSGSQLRTWLTAGPGPLSRLATPARVRAVSRQWMPFGPRVAVIGADLAAIELAEFLAERGRRVSVLEAAEAVAPEIGLKRRTEHMDRLDALGVSLNTGIGIERITRSGVEIRVGASVREVLADSVVIAGSIEADSAVYDALSDACDEVHAIGDCTGLGLIRKAIDDATRVACAL